MSLALREAHNFYPSPNGRTTAYVPQNNYIISFIGGHLTFYDTKV